MLPTVSRSLWALPLSLTRAERERGGKKERGGRGSNCGDVRKREGEGEREPGRENKQDRGCSVCQVSGEFQNVLHRCSLERKTPGGLSAPGAVIYHQSGEVGRPLWPMQSTHKDSNTQNRCVRRTYIQMSTDNANPPPIRPCISKKDTCMADSSIKNKQMCRG